MRMAGPDIILFVIGAVLFAGAGYGLVATGGLGGTTSALGVFNVDYTTSNVEVDAINVASFAGTAAHEFTVTQADVTKVLITIACTDPAGPGAAAAPFNLILKVEGPNGLKTTRDVTGRCGTAIEATIDVADIPPANVVLGRDDAEARDNLPVAENATAAQGKWTATITGARNPQPPVPLANPGGTVTLSVEQWAPRFEPVQR